MMAREGTGLPLRCSTLTPPLPHQRRSTFPVLEEEPQGKKLPNSINPSPQVNMSNFGGAGLGQKIHKPNP
jgi:hypothetical protein